tara:strand:- start:4371 stop:5756 length:1386 start_codon:yes stop_codon:yes gene_type:complete
MTRLRSLIKEVLSQPKKKDCGCGCNTCGDKAPILTEGKFKSLISEGLQHHIDKNISLFESVYRIGSDKHLGLIREARALWIRGIIEVSDDDKGLLETHLGHFGLYEGVEVPLDLPMVEEEESNMPSQEEVDKFFSITQNEMHYLNSKPVMGQEGDRVRSKIEPWDEYDLSNWNALVRKAKSQGKINEKEGVPHYTKDGKEWKGKVHKMPNGKLMTQNPHNEDSEELFHKEDLNENNLLRQTNLSSEEYQKAKKLKGFNADDYTFSSDNNLYVKDFKEKKSKFKKHGEMSGFDMRGINEEDLKENNLLKQAKLSSEEYQKAKKLKDFNKDDYEWNSTESLYVKEKKSKFKKHGEMSGFDMRGIDEAKKKKEKKDPPLNKPKRGGSKAYYVYVRDPKTKKIKKVSFGSGGLRAKIKNKQARNAFAARHKCSTKKDRTKAGYWSCNLPRYADQLGLGSKMNTFW